MWDSALSRYHAGAWLLWLAAAMLATLTTRNPYYLALIIGVCLVVNKWLERPEAVATPEPGLEDERLTAMPGSTTPSGPDRRGRLILLRTVVAITVGVALLKGLSLHLGTTVLFRLPEEWPVVGGPITLESLISSGLDALTLLSVLAVFAAFSAGADYYAILRSLPPSLHQVGLITSIAITFVPQTVTRFAEIREAQALRGHRVRRVGDLLPLIMPLLAGGLERSLNLAEAMESRGFSRNPAGSRRVSPVVVQSGLAAGLGLTLVGGTILAFQSTIPIIGWAVIASGVVILGATLLAMGKGTRRYRYRRSVWRKRDIALAALSVGVVAFVVTYRLLEPRALVYYPFPRAHLPAFDPIVALALTFGLSAPTLIPVAREISLGRTVYAHGKIRLLKYRPHRPNAKPPGGAGGADTAAHSRHVRE
jgi:energy-coupling factor transport system permease protein